MKTRKSKQYKTEKQISHAIKYHEWWSKLCSDPYTSYEYDFDGELALVNICLLGDCLHTDDAVDNTIQSMDKD